MEINKNQGNNHECHAANGTTGSRFASKVVTFFQTNDMSTHSGQGSRQFHTEKDYIKDARITKQSCCMLNALVCRFVSKSVGNPNFQL